MIGVDGRIQTRNFEGQDGKRVYITEVMAESIQFLETKGSSGQSGQGSTMANSSNNNQNFQRQTQEQSAPKSNNPFEREGEPVDLSDDDLPF